MKVLMITPFYFPIIGGTETLIESISMKLNEIGVQADVLTFNFETNPRRLNEGTPVWGNLVQKINGIKVIKISSIVGIRPFKLLQVGFIPGNFFKYLKNYDIIHFHNEVDLAFPLFSYFIKKPKIMHCHCLDVSYPYYKKNQVSRYIFQNIADTYIAVSRPIRDLLINLDIPEPNIRIVHNGVDTNKLRPSKKAKDENLLLFVGRLQPKKGLHVLLESLEYLATPVKLIIIGPLLSYYPEYKNEINVLIERANEKSIHKINYLGLQDTKTLIEWYQKAAIFVCPSLSEPFGIVNLEALSCGTPVIASNVGGIPEAVQNNKNSILVKPNDPTKLADAIQFLLDNEKVRREFGENGRKWVVEHFSQEVVVEKVLKVYTELLANCK